MIRRRVQLLGVLLASIAISVVGGAQVPNTPAKPGSVQPVASQSYILGPEDVITVTTIDHPEYSGEFLVANDGRINVPGIGEVTASGRSLTQLADRIRTLLRTNKDVGLLRPVVTCSLKLARSQRVYVLGNVRLPGVYDSKPGWRITEALAAAGGLADINPGNIAEGSIQIQYSDFTVNLLSASTGVATEFTLPEVFEANSTKNLTMQSGDVLTVRRYEALTVYVAGSVTRPGVYQLLPRNNELLKVISMAGSFLPTASTTHVTVTHSNGVREAVDLSGAMQLGVQTPTIRLQSGDLVLVPESQARVAVLGLVRQPGIYPLTEGKTLRVNDAIALAQGYQQRAKLSRVGFIQYNDGKPTHRILDFRKWLREGNLDVNPILREGDVVIVPETDTPDWGQLFSGVADSFGILFGNNRGIIK